MNGKAGYQMGWRPARNPGPCFSQDHEDPTAFLPCAPGGLGLVGSRCAVPITFKIGKAAPHDARRLPSAL